MGAANQEVKKKYVDRGGDRSELPNTTKYQLFLNSINHLPDEKRTRLIAEYAQAQIPKNKK